MEIFLKGYILRSWFILYQNFGVGGYFGVVPCPSARACGAGGYNKCCWFYDDMLH